MTEEMQALALRLVECKHWRWMEGMRPWHGTSLPEAEMRCTWTYDEDEDPVRRYHMGLDYVGAFPAWGWPGEGSGWIPDLTDPATLGCLEHLIIEAYGGAVVLTRGNGWWSVDTDKEGWDYDIASSYQEALVCALEAAP